MEGFLKVVIMCVTAEEVKNLYEFLMPYKKTLIAHEKMDRLKFELIKKCWDASDVCPILLCTDTVLSQLDITDADWLIHYSVALNTKTRFNFRFSTLLNNLRKEKVRCKVTLFVDENNDLQIHSILQIMKRMNVPVPQSLLENVERIAVTLDRNKKGFPICDNVKSLGFCLNKHSCVYRHCVLPDVDAPIIPIGIDSKVKFNVLYVHDATHFSVRILEYTQADSGKRIVLPSEDYIQLSVEMQAFYANVNNRRYIEASVGTVCTLEDTVDHFKRVQVIKIENNEGNGPGVLSYADVRCIDTGIIMARINTKRLLWIPEHLSNWPIHVMELFLIGIAPYDDEYIWNQCANDAVHKWFSENLQKRSYVVGTVRLNLGNTIWTDTLEIGTEVIGHPDAVGFSLKAHLLAQNHTVKNEEHIQQLHKLCRTGGLDVTDEYNRNGSDDSVNLIR